MLREGIEEVAGDEGFRVGIFGDRVSVSSAGCVAFEHGYGMPVHGCCDVVCYGCLSFELCDEPFG